MKVARSLIILLTATFFAKSTMSSINSRYCNFFKLISEAGKLLKDKFIFFKLASHIYKFIKLYAEEHL
jgi:hypothetical protein